jgi:acetylornithine/succinyldiaminopimelate/putrescine aminotransferase
MVGVQLAENFPKGDKPPALQVVAACMRSGLLLIPAGDSTVRFLPPLNATAAEIDEGVGIFTRVLKSFENPPKT